MKTLVAEEVQAKTMKALVYHSPGLKAWENKPKPTLLQTTDAIVRVTTTTICGTDLHIMKGDVPTVTTGRTGQNKLLHFTRADGRTVAAGSFADVMVTGAARHHLSGELVEVTARPRHRTRIPVAAG